MIPFGEAAVLDVWTTARTADRSALIDHLARLVLGERAAAAPWDVATRELLLVAAGHGRPDVVADCPRCGIQVEATVPVDHLVRAHDERRATREPADGGADHPQPRPPAVADVLAAAALPPGQAAEEIAVRCGLDMLDDADFAATVARWNDEHVLLAPSLTFTCPGCGGQVEFPIDVVDLAWATVSDLAVSVLDDVIALARGFGWTEDEVLALPPARRRLYRDRLEEVGAHG